MKLPEIKYCPCTLQPGFTTYSPAGQQQLFGNRSKKVSHILSLSPPGKNNAQTKVINERLKHVSFSGVQGKISLKLEKNRLVVAESNGTHILKPIPAERFDRLTDLPANEHVTMQIARQVFGIRTAASGIIFFEDGTPAYITRRFDHKPDGIGKYQIEDFASMLARSPEHEQDSFKYDASYLDIATQIKKSIAAAPVALLEFFRLVVFNYIVANGDAHLKNFSILETSDTDYLLAPAYDLICTALHIDDSSLALKDGLYKLDYEEETFGTYGFYTATSFIVFAEKAGINPAMAATIVEDLIQGAPKAKELIKLSYLSKEAKKEYLKIIDTRVRNLQFK